MFKKYQHIQNEDVRPYIKNEDISDVFISQFDKDNGSPKKGDMIFRNSEPYNDQWLVSKQYYKENRNKFTVKGKKIKVYVDDVKNPKKVSLIQREWTPYKTIMLVCSVYLYNNEKNWRFNLTTLNGDINNPIVDVDLWYTDDFKLLD